MSYKVLYRKYRPDSFDSVVGQDYTVKMLKNAINTGKHAHAYIFTGPRGTGKTTSAKIFAKALCCENPMNGNPCNECKSCISYKENPDIIEIDAASNNGVEQIRELINNVKLVPTASKYKVYIIDEVHMLTESAYNALLLTLEEPPAHVVFILATTDIQRVPITILSRCQRFDFKSVNRESIINRLSFICAEESIDIDEEALAEIALISAGGMRDALGMLDQLSSNDEKITLDVVSNYFGGVSVKKIDELLTSIEQNNVENLLEILGNIRVSGTNYSVFIEKLISELRKCAMEIKSGKSKHDFYFDDIYNMIFDLNECLSNLNINIDPYMLIEIVLLKYIKTGEDNIRDESPKKEDKIVNAKLGNISKSEEISAVKEKVEEEVPKKDVIHKEFKCSINLEVRVNNCFVEASKDQKTNISKSWVDFMNYLMTKDRSMISLLADTVILAASSTYVLIQSKISTTNDLINSEINKLEKFYEDFSGNKYRFAAINEDLWEKETKKYRFNLNNKIKYSYMEENIEDSTEVISADTGTLSEENIEDVAKDIFGTFEVE